MVIILLLSALDALVTSIFLFATGQWLPGIAIITLFFTNMFIISLSKNTKNIENRLDDLIENLNNDYEESHQEQQEYTLPLDYDSLKTENAELKKEIENIKQTMNMIVDVIRNK